MLVAGDRNLERSGGEQSEGACQGITAENQQSVGIFGKSAINRDFFGKSAEIRQKLTGRHKEHCLFIKSIGYQKSYESEQMNMTKSRSISTVEGSGATCTRNFFELFFQNR